jgi:hypothetical protein
MDVEFLKLKLNGWADQIACRFGYPVYVVGSALTKENPRDIDIVVMLPVEDFISRYGSINEWLRDTWVEWGETRQRWAVDVAKISRDATKALSLNIDFKIQPMNIALQENAGKPKLRIDNLICIKDIQEED